MATSEDSWIVISGAGGAIGAVLTAHYGNLGRRVLALDRKFEHGTGSHQSITRRTVDLLVEDEVYVVISEILSPRNASLLINAVGQIWNEPLLAFRGGKLATHAVASWRRVLDANLTASFIMAKCMAAHMAAHGGGCIINFSSIASGGNAGQAAYSAAKAGIEGLTRTMALELGPLGVRVNALALGFIDASTTREAVAEKQLDEYRGRTPLGRLGQVDDVINAVEFLATNAFVNGAIVQVDGGLRL
jgi:3-oxoacyl-[acyl-carrier protein] reductase